MLAPFNRHAILHRALADAISRKVGALVSLEHEQHMREPQRRWIEMHKQDWYRAEIRERRALYAQRLLAVPLAERVAMIAARPGRVPPVVPPWATR